MKKPMEFAQWAVATLIAAATMAIMFTSLVQGLFYGRAEGSELEKRVDRMEASITHTAERLDRIFELLNK